MYFESAGRVELRICWRPRKGGTGGKKRTEWEGK